MCNLSAISFLSVLLLWDSASYPLLKEFSLKTRLRGQSGKLNSAGKCIHGHLKIETGICFKRFFILGFFNSNEVKMLKSFSGMELLEK
ncbi:MAG: hypothetical protein Q8N88_01380, partial [Nanoarchaeota archaeon]|nr:hypothetical protein [Nanoarchaeota archaeon]